MAGQLCNNGPHHPLCSDSILSPRTVETDSENWWTRVSLFPYLKLLNAFLNWIVQCFLSSFLFIVGGSGQQQLCVSLQVRWLELLRSLWHTLWTLPELEWLSHNEKPTVLLIRYAQNWILSVIFCSKELNGRCFMVLGFCADMAWRDSACLLQRIRRHDVGSDPVRWRQFLHVRNAQALAQRSHAKIGS